MSLKCFFETDVHPFLLANQRGITQCHHYIGRSSHVNLKWAWNESELELFAQLVAFNTNGKRIYQEYRANERGNKSLTPKIAY